MNFINRKKELDWLKQMYQHRRKKLFPLVIFGPRRVGKTTLIREFIKDKKAAYFYINENKSSHVLGIEAARYIKRLDNADELTSLDGWDNILRYLIEKSNLEIIVFDEFQNFRMVDRSVFGILQNLIDKNENKKGPLIIFSGSSTGMLKEVFEDTSAALYGRMKSTLFLKPLTFTHFYKGIKTLGKMSDRDIAGFYFVFGGYPKYLTVMEDFEIRGRNLEQVLERLFFMENAPLQNEVKNLLRTEFGRRGSQNYAILEAIATGHTKLSEIASYVSMSATSLSPFLNQLADYHDLVERNVPLLRPKAKDTRYSIKIPVFRFWFSFVKPYESQLELGLYGKFIERVKERFRNYSGKEFGRLCKEHLKKGLTERKLHFDEVGGWWHNENEIDILSIGKRTCVWECKWENINKKKGKEILQKLRNNSEIAGIKDPDTGLFAIDIEDSVKDEFDYVTTLGDIIEGKFPQ